MFNLIYRDGAPECAGHYECLETSVSLKLGQAASLSGGKAVAATGDLPVYGIVSEPTEGGFVSVLKVEGDMVFRCPLSAAPTSLVKGSKVTLADGLKVTATAPASGKYGAVVADLLGAKAAGDFIEVRFEN